MVLDVHVVLCMTEANFLKITFYTWNEETSLSLGFFENLVIGFFSILSIMKVYINYCVLRQISYLEKFWYLRYGSKCSWLVRLQDFKSNIFLQENDEKVCFFVCCYKFIEIKRCLKNIEVDMVINGCATLIAGLQNWLYPTKKLME